MYVSPNLPAYLPPKAAPPDNHKFLFYMCDSILVLWTSLTYTIFYIPCISEMKMWYIYTIA